MVSVPSDLSRQPDGVPAWVDLLTPDPGPLSEFYAGLFGWEFRDLDTARPYRVASVPGGDVAGVGALDIGNPGWTMYVRVRDLEETERRVLAAGGRVREPAHEAFGGGRRSRFEDPAGAVFGAWARGEHEGAVVVDAASSSTVSELHTPDAASAADFYQAVFGRETAVARIVADADGTPRWHVTFAVADPDDAAARARELGGSVRSEPSEEHGPRSAELADPQGFPFRVIRSGAA